MVCTLPAPKQKLPKSFKECSSGPADGNVNLWLQQGPAAGGRYSGTRRAMGHAEAELHGGGGGTDGAGHTLHYVLNVRGELGLSQVWTANLSVMGV